MSLDASSKTRVLDPAELRWCSKKRRSAPPKRISRKKLLRFIGIYRLAFQELLGGWSMALKMKLYNPDAGRRCSNRDILVCAKTALSSWNTTSLSQQGPEYKLVKALSAVNYEPKKLYHCNFTARPRKSWSDAQDKLFFAELQDVPRPENNSGQYDLLCQFCCILGPAGCETGPSDCGFCHLHHPEAGFTKAGFIYKHLDASWIQNQTKLTTLPSSDG